MQWLLDQLSKPQITSTGEIKGPSTVMLKAANVITQLHQLFETDKAGRLVAEAKLAESIAEEQRLRSLLPGNAHTYYKEAMNAEYIREFT